MIKILKQYPGVGPTSIDYSPSKIVYKMIEESFELEFKDLASRPDFGDYSYFAVDMHAKPISFLAKPKEPIVSVYPHTVGSKLTPRQLSALGGNKMNLMIHVFVPSAQAKSFDDCLVAFVTTDDVTANVEFKELDSVKSGLFAEKPTLKITGPATLGESKTEDFELKYVDSAGKIVKSDVEVFLETTAGYLAHQRVKLTAGKGTFRLAALHLRAGETIRVKAGFRHFTGVAEKEVAVTA